MNIISDSCSGNISEGSFSINQEDRSGGWEITSGSKTAVLSLNVFGTVGNRYSVMVIEKEQLSGDYTGRNGKWFLKEINDEEGQIRFDLQWAVDAAGSGCLVLCGKETPARFVTSA